MTEHLLFLLGFSFFIVHEMDAIRCKEWRIIPGLSLLDDIWGFRIFMLIHVPLLIILLGGLANQAASNKFIFALDLFFIFHIILHIFFLKHRKNEFKDWTSWSIIILTAIFGVLDLTFSNYI